MFQPNPKGKKYSEFKSNALLAGFNALLGEVSPKLRSVNIDWDQNTVYLYFYFDGKVTEEDHESAEMIATETIAKFGEHVLETKIVRIDFPKAIPNTGIPIFHRKENDVEQDEKRSILEQAIKGTYSPRVLILLGIMKGLLGTITPNLRAITFDSGNALFFYYDGDISDIDRENVASIANEVSLEVSYKIKVDILKWDYPKPIPSKGVEFIYLRRE
ncbi:MAG TPA: hypothetical protein VFU89_05810 [Rhabdochlamydiaceae bacterium]|nr:hypothetical protein [Rhabdochlamydiaceae bacterium]